MDYSERDRSKIPAQYKWDLTDLYEDIDGWKRAQARLVSDLPLIEKFRGSLASSPRAMLECLDSVSRLTKEHTRLHCYASMNSDLDTRDATFLGMDQQMSQIASELAAATAFIEPEILTMDRMSIDEFIRQEPNLEVYRHGLYDILRKKEHTGSEPEEKIIAEAGLMADGPVTTYGVFSNAEFPFPEVELSGGRTVKLDKAAFALHKAAPHREDRKKVFAAYFGKLGEYRRTFGAQLSAEVKKNLFYVRARRYASCLERALDRDNIPVAVYKNLIDNVNTHLDTYHRYLRLRKRMLGVDELHYYDLYAPLVKHVDLHYTYEEAAEHTLASLKSLGEEYGTAARAAFDHRWVDVYPNEGKRSGAYSNGAAYDVHPYMLLNYNGKFEDMSTLAHELGHTMHSYLTNTTQAYPLSHYSIFVAEVASTFNEALLLDYLLHTITDDAIRLSLLGEYLDGIRGTVFRQVQFAEFEWAIHRVAEKGEALTGDTFGQIYDEINRKYQGHDKGVCVVDDEIKAEWAHIPHFYYNFYVYQYATSFTASAALSEQVIAGDREAMRRYLELLRSGGSDYPIELLKKAGVDMTTSRPLELTMRKMNRVMDEIEGISATLKDSTQTFQ